MAWAAGFVDDAPMTKTTTGHFAHPLVQRMFQACHFIPGPESSVVIPGSELAYTLVERASGWVAKGLALHALMDTFAHRGWSGLWEDVNDAPAGDLVDFMAPAIGHAKVGRRPDLLTHDWTWTDPRNGQVIDNRERAFTAALATWEFLRPDPMALMPDIRATFEGDYGGYRYENIREKMAKKHGEEFNRAALRHLGSFLHMAV